MSNFDASRQKDLKLIDDKLHDPKTTRRGKRYLEYSRLAIQRQENDAKIKNLRGRLLKATQANDAEAVAQIEELLKKHDREKGYDQYDRHASIK